MEYRRKDGKIVVVEKTSEIIGRRKGIVEKKVTTKRTIFDKRKSRMTGGSVIYTTIKEKE